MGAREIAEKGTILRALVGSTVHGLNLPGTDDRDEMGICIEPPSHVVGLSQFEQYVSRTQPEGVRSGPGDLDLTIYSLRKYCRLAEQGNPSILLLLYVPEDAIVTMTHHGNWLRLHRDLFASRQAGARFLGYLTSQKQRLLGERGQMNVKRPELLKSHGYDTKYAGHMLRLGYQGVEFLETGKITLPMPEPYRANVLAVRRGEVDLNTVLTTVGELEATLSDLRETSPLPEKPDRDRINQFLVDCYMEHWVENGIYTAA
jgi:uncharacterized protein